VVVEVMVVVVDGGVDGKCWGSGVVGRGFVGCGLWVVGCGLIVLCSIGNLYCDDGADGGEDVPRGVSNLYEWAWLAREWD
jgi:hypothetical protein